ncbi:hypothetical protein GCM10022222_50060 [Amycolatopsis ultiminotia]|uniref:Uncharacterized protein n=1 Tax=Amycolatopsis ultiminotia TaxID=543629 RepID=A0ABP6X4Q2_9PSEU
MLEVRGFEAFEDVGTLTWGARLPDGNGGQAPGRRRGSGAAEPGIPGEKEAGVPRRRVLGFEGFWGSGPECRTGVSDRSVGPECRTGVSDRSVGPECRTGVSDRSVG